MISFVDVFFIFEVMKRTRVKKKRLWFAKKKEFTRNNIEQKKTDNQKDEMDDWIVTLFQHFSG